MKVSLVSIPVQDPIEAHEIYTKKLGFTSKEFNKEASLAIVVSAEDPNGTALLLEPCRGSFAEAFQKAAYDANLPIMVFAVKNVRNEVERLKGAGVEVRPDLDKAEWVLESLFEDGCGGGRTLEHLASHARRGKAVGIDYSADSVAVARIRNHQLIANGRVERMDVGGFGFWAQRKHKGMITMYQPKISYFWRTLK